MFNREWVADVSSIGKRDKINFATPRPSVQEENKPDCHIKENMEHSSAFLGETPRILWSIHLLGKHMLSKAIFLLAFSSFSQTAA